MMPRCGPTVRRSQNYKIEILALQPLAFSRQRPFSPKNLKHKYFKNRYLFSENQKSKNFL